MRLMIAFLILGFQPALGFTQNSVPNIHVVFVTPADVEVPEGVSERMTQVVEYTETFLVKGMREWDYPPVREKLFPRNEDGSAKIWFVKSPDSLASGKFPMKEGNMARKGKILVREQHKIDTQRDIWWVWVYLGDPPLRYSSYLGSGNAAQGGLCQVNYTNIPGTIPMPQQPPNKFMEDFTLKGTIHEFGHALGLPHNGPLEKRDLGIPLMGATYFNYRKRMKNQEQRVYLTEASAAILWKHPVFTGDTEKRQQIPKVKWRKLEIENDSKDRVAHLLGQVTSNIPVHSVIVYDVVPKIQQTYFQKPYVARIEPDGTFKVTISEPIPRQVTGELKVIACCDNGCMTGNGTSRGINSAHILKYKTTRMGFEVLE